MLDLLLSSFTLKQYNKSLNVKGKLLADHALKNKAKYCGNHGHELYASAVDNIKEPVYTKGIRARPLKKIAVCSSVYTLRVLYNPYALYINHADVSFMVSDDNCQLVIFVGDDFMQQPVITQDHIIQTHINKFVLDHVTKEMRCL